MHTIVQFRTKTSNLIIIPTECYKGANKGSEGFLISVGCGV